MDASFLERIAAQLRANVEVKDRNYRLKTYPQSFVGSDAVQYFLDAGVAQTVDDAVAIGEGLLQLGIFHHVTKDHGFENAELFYRFAEDEAFHGGPSEKPGGGVFSWGDALLRPRAASEVGPFQPELPSYDVIENMESEKAIPVSPLDEYNVQLLDNVKPKNWKNPDPGNAKFVA